MLYGKMYKLKLAEAFLIRKIIPELKKLIIKKIKKKFKKKGFSKTFFS
jgi:hypothetical protein